MTLARRTGIPHVLTLLVGVLLGWGLCGSRPAPVRAAGGDRFDESILTSGPTSVQYNQVTKSQVTQDGIYFLDYRSGKLLATIPIYRKTVGGSRMVEAFAERDLVADFKIDLDAGARPHFLMTTGSISLNDGGSPLFVFESTTRQVAIYRLQQKYVGTSAAPTLELMETHPFGKPVAAPR